MAGLAPSSYHSASENGNTNEDSSEFWKERVIHLYHLFDCALLYFLPQDLLSSPLPGAVLLASTWQVVSQKYI